MQLKFFLAIFSSILLAEAVPISVTRSSSSSGSSAGSGATASANSGAHAGSSSGSSSSDHSFKGDATFYKPEADACGTSSTSQDFVAALNHPQFFTQGVDSDQNPNCGKIAHIVRGDKSVSVKIVDECPECNDGDLDLSPAAFKEIADPIEGRVKINWYWEE